MKDITTAAEFVATAKTVRSPLHLQCPFCKAVPHSIWLMLLHLENFHGFKRFVTGVGINDNWYRCLCGHKFRQQSSLFQHLLSFTKEGLQDHLDLAAMAAGGVPLTNK
jgi:hypothetical protein